MNTEVRRGVKQRVSLQQQLTLGLHGVERRTRTITLTLRGGVMLGVAILSVSVAYIAAWPELLVLGSFCAIPPLLALVVVARRRPRFIVERFTAPAMVSAGATGSVRLRLRSASRAVTASERWSDDLPWSPGKRPWRDMPALNPGEEVTLHYDAVPPRRGVVELGPLVVDVGDPFGLARGEFSVGSQQRVVVSPESVDLGQALADLASDSGSARLFHHRALAGDHDIMTRDYRPGDALRRVHWKASAHHGELMVREDEKRSHAESVIFVDTRRQNWRDVSRSPSPDRPDSERFEWALSMVASLRDYLIRHGLRVSVVESAVRQLADAEHAEEFIESLARVQLSYHDGPAVRMTEKMFESVSSLFAIVDAPDDETITALVEQRREFGLAVVFLMGPSRGNVEARLSGSGWMVQRVPDGESVGKAWQSWTTGVTRSEAHGDAPSGGASSGAREPA